MNEAIDSLKVRIPLRKVEVLEEGLLNQWKLVNTVTGEEDEEFKNKAYTLREKGITTRYAFNPMGEGKDGKKRVAMNEDEIIILLNAKLLGKLNNRGKSYFEGISRSTYYDLHRLILEQGIISVSPEALSNARVSDIDVKSDHVMLSRLSQDTFVKALDSKTKPSKSIKRGSNPTYHPNKLICTWGTREGATESSPFCKTYAKDLELVSEETIQFKEAYNIECPDFMQRVEVTIKNKKMFERMKGSKLFQDFNLDYVLSLSQKDILSLIHVSLSKHFENFLVMKKVEGESSSMLDKMIALYLHKVDCKTTAVDDFKRVADTRQQVTKFKKKVGAIWELEFSGTDKGEAGHGADLFLEHLGF